MEPQPGGQARVITSYSIHYTKLYEKDIELIYVIGNPDKPTPNTMVNESTQIFLKKLKQFKYEEQTILSHKFISDQFGIRASYNFV